MKATITSTISLCRSQFTEELSFLNESYKD